MQSHIVAIPASITPAVAARRARIRIVEVG